MKTRDARTGLTCTTLALAAALVLQPASAQPGPASPVPPALPAPLAAEATLMAAPPVQPSTGSVAAAAPSAPASGAGGTPPAGSAATDARPAPDAASAEPGEAPPIVGTEVAPPVEAVIEAPALNEDLWMRVRQNAAMPTLDGELVRRWEQFYLNRPDYMQRMFERGGRYLFHIVEEVGKRGLPAELALLPFIESAFNPHAQSSARASGIWQFMPATGRHFDLRQNVFRDDRRSVLESTRAALDYLQQLHEMFDDWHLALAAYNWGQGNVARAQANNRRRGLPTGYRDLSMPEETRNYVPKLQAIVNLVMRPEAYGLELPVLRNHPYFLTVSVDRDIDVTLATRLAGMSAEEFLALNPQMNKPVILAAGTPQLLMPFDNARRYQREIAQHRGPFATWTAWVAPRTVKPAEAARLVGMGEQQLREVNRIPPRMLVKAGSTLLVPRSPQLQHDVSEHLAENASISLAPEAVPGKRRVVKAGPRGETVAALAQRYRVSAAQLASWNGVSAQSRFKAGQAVVLYAPATRSHATAGHRPAAPAAKGARRTAQKTAARAPRVAMKATAPTR